MSLSFLKFQELLSIIYDGLPRSVRVFLSPVVEPAFSTVKRALLIASQICPSVYRLQGKERWGDRTLTTLLFGEGMGINYFSDLLYAQEPLKETLGRVFICKVKSKLNLDILKADLVLIGMDGFFSRFLSRQGFIIIPEWVLFKLDLTKPLPEIWKLSKNRSLQENLREIRKNKYSYEITRDPAEFEYFYHKMYSPYAMKRYEKLAILMTFRHMKRIFEKGGLLLVKRGDERISGFLIRINNKTVWAAYAGIREGKIEYLKRGALAACYYFTISWAKEKGYELLDFGHCRPFLDDGVFLHKKKWGMEIGRSNRVRAVFGMKICNPQPGLLDFLAKNPFVFIDQEGLKGLILTVQDHPLTHGELQAILKTYYTPGIDCLVILSPQGFTQQAEEFASSRSTQRLYLTNLNPDAFFEGFPHVLRDLNG